MQAVWKMVERLSDLPDQRVQRECLIDQFYRQCRRLAECKMTWRVHMAMAEARISRKPLTCVSQQQCIRLSAIRGRRQLMEALINALAEIHCCRDTTWIHRDIVVMR